MFDQLVTLCLFSRSRSCCGIGVLVLVGCPLALLTFGFSGSGFGGAALFVCQDMKRASKQASKMCGSGN